MFGIIKPLTSLALQLPTSAASMNAAISALRGSISSLESSLKTVEDASPFWEAAGWFCSLLVVVGVAAEVWAIVWGYREEREAWRHGIVRAPDHPSVAKFWFEIAATLLVVFGVLGETISSEKVASVNSLLRSKTSELRAKSDQLLALVTEEAGNAEASAKGAAEAASRAKGDADKAMAEVAEAFTRAKDAQTLAAEDEDKARQIAKTLRLAQPRWWLFDKEQRRKMVAALKPFAGQNVDVRHCKYNVPSAPLGTDNEVNQLVMTISGLLDYDAHWDVPPAIGDMQECGGQGIWVWLDPQASESTKRAAKALTEQLFSIGIAAGRDTLPGPKPRPSGHDHEVYVDNGVTSTRPPQTPDTIVISINPHV